MASLPETFSLFHSGRFHNSESSLEVINPFTGIPFARVAIASESDYENAVSSALSSRSALKSLSSGERSSMLASISAGIESRKELFTCTICQESGKPWKYAAAEVDRGIETFKIASREALNLPAEYLSLDSTPAGKGREGIVRYFPAGIVAGITPFNFPLNLVAHKVAPALAAGCPIIIKPASKTPLTSLLLAREVSDAGFPPGSFAVLPMNRQEGDKMVTDPRFAVLSFTGSPEIGWEMKKRSGKKKVVLELGGNAGVIVSNSADISFAAGRCVMGAFAYSGQVCIHAQRIFAEAGIFDSLVSLMIEKTRLLKRGDPLDPQTDISAMIDLANAERVESWVDEAVGGGAKVLFGGKRDGSYYEPTILGNASAEMKVCSEEIFGPIVTVNRYNEFSEAIAGINNTRFGLQAGIFTDSVAEMDQAFNELDVGGVILNDVPTLRFDNMPYGGIKDSGFGREGVKYAMLDMLEAKILVK